MARCENCNKFVSFDDPEINVDSDDVNWGSERVINVTVSVCVNRNCSDCGSTLRTATFDIEHEIKLTPEDAPIAEGAEITLDLEDPEENSRSEGKGRGMKSFIGFVLRGTVTVQDETPGDEGEDTKPPEPRTFEFEVQDEMQASHFDEA